MAADGCVREAVAADLPLLGAIEIAAAAQFAGVGIHGDFLHHATRIDDLGAACKEGRLWVAVGEGRPVGFALACRLRDGQPWLEELDVHPDHARRGLGRALVETVIAWARQQGAASLALTTFVDVAWNAPFYARLGFRPFSPAEHSTAIAEVLEEEEARGLPLSRRVAMRLELPPRSPQR
ncbi:MAG: GNAT family N-acetyltransferase [Candidatus Binatia bacterium]